MFCHRLSISQVLMRGMERKKKGKKDKRGLEEGALKNSGRRPRTLARSGRARRRTEYYARKCNIYSQPTSLRSSASKPAHTVQFG
jgi:hypothetical protein